jgi:transcriptional regulator with XRE-family HTH domain
LSDLLQTNFPERLCALRAERGLTQSFLANIAKVTDRAIRNYESGSQSPTLKVLLPLAEYFNVSMDYLIGRSDDPMLR